FSSRRRHTRCLSDWSSDVCSSDLPWQCFVPAANSPAYKDREWKRSGAARYHRRCTRAIPVREKENLCAGCLFCSRETHLDYYQMPQRFRPHTIHGVCGCSPPVHREWKRRRPRERNFPGKDSFGDERQSRSTLRTTIRLQIAV